MKEKGRKECRKEGKKQGRKNEEAKEGGREQVRKEAKKMNVGKQKKENNCYFWGKLINDIAVPRDDVISWVIRK